MLGGRPGLAPLRSHPDPPVPGAERGTKTGTEPWKQRHRGAETDGERQACMDTEAETERGQRKHSRAKTLGGRGSRVSETGKTERKDTSHNEGHGMEIGIVQRQKVKEREQEIA